MNEKESYLFDLQGFLVVEDALSANELSSLNRILEERVVEAVTQDDPTHRFGDLLNWGQPYLDLIDHPRVLPYLEELVGTDLRLDHVYLDIIRSGLSPIGASLHGGMTPGSSTHFYRYHNGRMTNGLTVVAYNLEDVGPEDGGFGCVPGSHKSNLAFPAEWHDMAKGIEPFVSRITGPAGTAVIFTEALTHGALLWKGKGERRTIFYKYSPPSVSWSAGYPQAEDFEGLNERQRQLLEAPNARYNGRQGKETDVSLLTKPRSGS